VSETELDAVIVGAGFGGIHALYELDQRGLSARLLDDAPDRDSILRQLRRAERQAREQGWAIAIGHPHPATLAVLRASLPQLEARGFRFVFASELVH